MYEQYFGFSRTPFRLESEPDMFFFGESQKNVLACIKNSLSLRKAIITLSGLPGSGKTTVMRRAIEESIVPDTIICRINRARCHHFLDTLKSEIRSRLKTLVSADLESIDLYQLVLHAVDEKKHFLVVVDESQQLTESEVDELFSLVSIEKDSRKYFKFLLVSHEPFHEHFDIAKYANTDELLSMHCFLLPLSQAEILPYIEHRLTNTGWTDEPSFSKDIEHIVFLITQGVPRRINSFFDRLMLFSYFESNNMIDIAFLKSFCRDLLVDLDTQAHPDLDSFDLRQALRREKRLFSLSEAGELVTNVAEFSEAESGQGDAEEIINKNAISDEPLASEDPEALIEFVSSFIKNPERYKNYTDEYYKIPQNLTLLLCLATESDRYIDDITPVTLSTSSAAEIKLMIATFIEKMLITSRFDPHRVLGLDCDATENEVNRHFNYMMRLCRSEYVTSDRKEFESVIKDAYIKLLSEHSAAEEKIPVVEDVHVVPKATVVSVANTLPFKGDAEKKLTELEKAKSMLSEVSSETKKISDVAESSVSDAGLFTPTLEKKRSYILPVSMMGLTVAAGLGYVFIGGGVTEKPDASIMSSQPSVVHSMVKEKKQHQYPELALLKEQKTPIKLKPKPAEKEKPVQKVSQKSAPVKTPAEAKSERTIKAELKKTELKKNELRKPEAAAAENSTAKKVVVDKLEQSPKQVVEPGVKQQVVDTPPVKVLASVVPVVVAEREGDAGNILAALSSENSVKVEGAFLERVQLDRVINNFKYVYENGDIEELPTLFVENAVTNQGFNRDQIIEDYELLFDESDGRSIVFNNITWKIDGDVAQGTGRFISSISSGDGTKNKEGRVSIKVVDSEETKKIVELFFLYQFAEIE